jgi:hypothetical protein
MCTLENLVIETFNLQFFQRCQIIKLWKSLSRSIQVTNSPAYQIQQRI